MDAGRGVVFQPVCMELYAVGLVVAGFEYAIQSQSGRGDLHGLALNGIKGFMAVSLFTTVPVELYRLCVTLQARSRRASRSSWAGKTAASEA